MSDTYRVFIKDCLNLGGRPKAELKVLSFDVSRDLMERASATFTVTEIVENINEGDVIGLIDPYGFVPYLGTVTTISEVTISSNQIESLFDDNWVYRVPQKASIEMAIKDIITEDFKNSSDPVMAAKYNFTIVTKSSTPGVLPAQDDNTVMNFEDFMYQMFNDYGITFDFDIPFEPGTPVLYIERKTLDTMKVANNSVAIRSVQVERTVTDRNKLVVYSEDGKTLRGTYFVDSNGVTTNARSGTRLPVVDTEFVFSDEDLDAIVQENLNPIMYNHFISFEMLLKSELYKDAWYRWQLSQPIDIWINGDYYNTIYTGYQFKGDTNSKTATVLIKCGKVRANLTSKILSIFARKVSKNRKIPLDWIDSLFEE